MQKNRKLRKNSNTKQMLKKGLASLLMLSMIMGSIPVCASESITEQSTEIQTEKEKSVHVQPDRKKKIRNLRPIQKKIQNLLCRQNPIREQSR